jgi:signal transduction histidine kinase
LILKLLAVNLAVIGFVVVIVWLAIDTLAAGYFVTLMEKYNISPGPAHAMFVGAVHRYLLWACLAAVILAVALSFLLMRRVLAPLTRMTAISREIATGNFAVRVPVSSADEVGQLALAFNRMAGSLEKIENLRRNLMIDVAHELRTPLTNIRGYLEALNDGVLPPSAETFALLQTETMRLVQLVEDVLQLARADAARAGLKPEAVDLRQMLDEVLMNFSTAFAAKSITVNLRTPQPPVIVAVDRYRFVRVLRNLTDNAARYAPQGDVVEIAVTGDSLKVAVDFSNSAEERVREDLPYLFERFFRGEKSRSRQHGGAGIGLAIVKELVEAHGGTVSAELSRGRIRIGFELPVAASQPTG